MQWQREKGKVSSRNKQGSVGVVAVCCLPVIQPLPGRRFAAKGYRVRSAPKPPLNPGMDSRQLVSTAVQCITEHKQNLLSNQTLGSLGNNKLLLRKNKFLGIFLVGWRLNSSSLTPGHVLPKHLVSICYYSCWCVNQALIPDSGFPRIFLGVLSENVFGESS